MFVPDEFNSEHMPNAHITIGQYSCYMSHRIQFQGYIQYLSIYSREGQDKKS